MPAWPTLYPLFMHYKRVPNWPYGTGDTSQYKLDQSIANDMIPDGLKTSELYAK